MIDWMVWATPVAVFFCCSALMLVGMTVWEVKSPATLRRGWLPVETTRGDRLFIGLLAAAYVNLACLGLAGKLQVWFGLERQPSIWWGLCLSAAALLVVMRKG